MGGEGANRKAHVLGAGAAAAGRCLARFPIAAETLGSIKALTVRGGRVDRRRERVVIRVGREVIVPRGH